MRYLKCNLLPERHEEILRKFWDYPTQEEEDAVHDLFTPHVFFETYGKRREVWATCCRQHGIIGKHGPKHGPKHGSEGSCPFCGQTAVWSAIGKYSERMTSLREETHVAFLRRDGDALLIEAMQIEISYTKDLIYGGIYYDMNCWGQKAYYFAPGTVQMWVRTREWRCGEWTLPYWKAKATVSEPFQPNMMGWACYQGDYTVIGADALSETKAWRYCQIEDWMHYELAERWEDEPVKWAVTYLAAYAMWPQIEMAVKLGLAGAVTQLVVHSLKNRGTLDWDAANPADFLRMSKQEAHEWLRSGGDFETLKSWRETAPELTPDVYIHLCRQLGGGRMVEACKECAEMAGAKLERAWCDYVGVPTANWDAFRVDMLVRKSHGCTFRELLALEHPDKVDARFSGGCAGCPDEYGYEPGNGTECLCEKNWNTKKSVPQICTECWDRIVPGSEVRDG